MRCLTAVFKKIRKDAATVFVSKLYYNTIFQIIKIKGRVKAEKVVKCVKMC